MAAKYEENCSVSQNMVVGFGRIHAKFEPVA